jgi:hypothetical protein
MTMRWGPLGWATLHSIAAAYPDEPTSYELELFGRWLRSFKDTILCPSCSKHFSDTIDDYTRKFPTWMHSRRGVVEFVLRAHNTVNARTYKPVYTLETSVAELQKILPESMIGQKRQEYILYIRSDWMKNMTLAGVSSAPKLRELLTIEENYWSRRPFQWADLLKFKGIAFQPLVEQMSVLGSTPNMPKIIAPARGYSLPKAGKIGRLSALR